MAKLTWLGDGDPSAQDVEVYGLRFIKGEATDVPDDHARIGKLRSNPLFSEEVDAEPTDLNDAAEKNALKERLKELGVEVKGNPSIETLRDKLASALG